MKVYEGAVLTCDAENKVFRYLVEDRGKIVYTGEELPEEIPPKEQDIQDSGIFP